MPDPMLLGLKGFPQNRLFIDYVRTIQIDLQLCSLNLPLKNIPHTNYSKIGLIIGETKIKRNQLKMIFSGKINLPYLIR